MKKLLTTTLLALASVALIATSAHATVTAAYPDVILGFQATGATGSNINLEVDLGNVSQFYNAAPGSTIPVTELSLADLQQAYGATWNAAAEACLSVRLPPLALWWFPRPPCPQKTP